MKRCPPGRAKWLAIAAGTGAIASQATALEMADLMAYKAGPMLIRPRASVAERYDDNVLYQKDGPLKKADFVTTTSPGFSLTIGRKEVNNPWFDFSQAPENYLSIGYDLNHNLYAGNSSLNSLGHAFDMSGRLIGNRLSLTGSDSIQMVDGLVGGNAGLYSNVKRLVYNDNYRLSYRVSDKLSAYLSGAYSNTDWEEGVYLLDNNSLTGTMGIDYKPLNKISFFSGNYYGQSAVNPNIPNTPKGPHLTSMGGYMGAKGEFTQRIQGTIQAGYEVREFSNHAEAGSSPVVNASLSYRIGPKTSTSVTYSRSASVSVQSPGVTYDADVYNLNFTKYFGAAKKLALAGDLSLSSYQYGIVWRNRIDDRLLGRISASYMLRAWLAAGFSYEFEQFSSTDKAVIDYSVNRVTMRLSVGY